MTRPPLRLLLLLALVLGIAQPPAQAEDRAFGAVFVGDVLLGGRMGPWLKKHGADYPSKHVQQVLKQGGLVFGNLECPLTTATVPTAGKTTEDLAAKKHFIFRADPVLGALALKQAGFTMMSVANNHAMDYRGVGLTDTIAAIEGAGIKAVGGGKDWDTAAAPRILPIEGFGHKKLGVLACSMINPPFSSAGETTPGTYAMPKRMTPFLKEQIELLDRKCDFVVLSIHWGVESSPTPTAYQRAVAQAAIDAGADLIVGHHPHCLQPMEWYQDKLIAYSLGNFIFPGKSKELPSVILKIFWQDEHGRYSPVLYPVLVRDGIPELTNDSDIRRQIKMLAPDVHIVDV